MITVRYREIEGDLFAEKRDCYFAHCISADFALGAGIARKFNSLYNMRAKLIEWLDVPWREVKIGSAILIDGVFNLVTKPRYFNKPTYSSLQLALLDMREQCVSLGIERLVMPRIGCGLDRLDWDTVRDLIKRVFRDTDVEITVYYLKEKE